MEFALGFDFAGMTIVQDKRLRMVGHRGTEHLPSDAPLDGRGITVKAANIKSAIRVPDTRKEPAYVDRKGFDWAGPPSMLSELAVPVMVDGEAVAVLNVESKQLNAFTVSDQDLLEILAFHVSSAFRRLKHEERLMTLHRHALQLSAATTVDEITKYTMDAMEFALGFDHADVRVVEDGWLRCRGARGMKMVNADLPLRGPGLTVKAANSRMTVRVSDTRKDTSYVDRFGVDWKGSPSILSELAVPVVVENATVAVLNVESAQPNAITDDDQTLLEMLAMHVASDITRLRDRDALQQQSTYLEQLVVERTKELTSARERLEYVIQSNPAVIYSGKPLADLSDWEMTYLSENLVAMLGYEPREFIGHPDFWLSILHPEDRPSVMKRVPRLWNEGRFTFEYRMRHKNGDYRWIREEANALREANGKPIEVYGYWTDVTARKQAEEALRESESKYRRLFESSPISLWDEDFSEVKKYLDELRGRGVRDFRTYFQEHPEDVTRCSELVKVLDVNHATLMLYDAESVSDFAGSLSRVLTKEPLDNFREEIVALAEGNTQFAGEIDNQTLTGEAKHVNVILNVIPGYEDTLARVLVSTIDLTQYKLMEKRLLKSERLAAIGQTAAMVGHDLRNPLQALAGASYVLKKHFENQTQGEERPTKPSMLEIAALIEDSVGYMNKIVSDLQDYAAPTHIEPVTVNISQLLNETLSTIRIPANVKVSLNLPDDAEKCIVDPALMRRVFTNLITNALQAMPNGGELKISTQKTQEETHISFQDTGTGIPETDLPNLFQPFHTTKAKGQGLGLPVCKRITEAHGGQITVNSPTGKGTTFTVKLPLSQNSE
jgi:PAS domain S-box-containing protein